MECNKDDAIRAKEIAEERLAVQDYEGAKKFALKAQRLYPSVENLAQIFAVIDVHAAARVRVNATEMDWYGILQVDHTADDTLIKKQYKKLALLLHPDKNKSPGAEAAFKLIGEASQVLSDKTKRMLHDMKKTILKTNQNAKVPDHVNSTQPTQNVQTGRSNVQYNGIHSQPTNTTNARFPRMPPQQPPLSTFWTACPSCRMRYQYHRAYENQNLLCPQCRLPFIAEDMNKTQENRGTPAYAWPPHFGSQHQQDFYQHSSKPFGTGISSLNGFTSATTAHSFQSHADVHGGVSGGIPATGPHSFQSHSDIHGGFSGSIPATGPQTWADYVQMYEKARWDKVQVDNREDKRKKEEEMKEKMKKEEQMKEKEMQKELRRREKMEHRKARAEEKAQEAMDRLMKKKEEQAEKAAAKEKKRRLKRHRLDSSDEDKKEKDGFLDDILSDDQEMLGLDPTRVHPRRSSRARRNVSYKVSGSDDEDIQDFAPSKKARGMGHEKEFDSGKLPSESGTSGREGEIRGIGILPEKEKWTQDSSQNIDMARKLADFAKNAIREKLNLTGVKYAGVAVDKEKNSKANVSNKTEREEKLGECVDSKADVGKSSSELQEKSDDGRELPSSIEGLEPETYTVPDADFHNFDAGREEKDIEVGQIWALYDDQEGMPRYYMKLREVHSYNPFKVAITWLELQYPSQEQLELLNFGFAFACGEFRNAKSQILDSVNSFSHIVKWEKGPKGVIRVYPRRGDIWALYRNWEPRQIIQEFGMGTSVYDMVEIITDYNKDTGVFVKPLIKVEGFKTVFRQSEKSTLYISPAELLRFSHHVPSHQLKGDEAPGVPEGSWELDPASVPVKLIFSGPDAERPS
eukprot:c29086_g1_i1 orf=1016-3589(-)